jgi:hypothetical protein
VGVDDGLQRLLPPRRHQQLEPHHNDDAQEVVAVVEVDFHVDGDNVRQVLVLQQLRDPWRWHHNVVQVQVVVVLGILLLLVRLEFRLFKRLAAIAIVWADWD